MAQLASAATQLSKAALSQLDLRQHSATHPRLGVVDHIVCNPLGEDADLSSAAIAAQAIGKEHGTVSQTAQLLMAALSMDADIHERAGKGTQNIGCFHILQNTFLLDDLCVTVA